MEINTGMQESVKICTNLCRFVHIDTDSHKFIDLYRMIQIRKLDADSNRVTKIRTDT